MATKKKGSGLDDFDSDLDFDVPDFGNSDDPELSRDDRKPIPTAVKSTAAAFGKSFANPARLRKTLTKALPREYDEPISKAFEIKDGVGDLYNNISQETRKTINEGKRGLGRIVRNLGDALPKKLRDKLERMTAVDEGGGSYTQSKEEAENASVEQAMRDVFAEDMLNRADERREDEAKDAIKQTIEKRRHKDMTSLLGSIDQSLLGMSTFQEKITTNYMKKTLELAIRGHFLQTEMLSLQARSFHEMTESLNAITKNTGLPDFVKKASKEHLAEHIRGRVFDSVSNTLANRRRQYLDGVFKRANTMVKDKFSEVRDGMGQLLDVGEMMSSMASSGYGPSIPEMAGEVAGGWLGGKVQDKAADRIRKYLAKNPKAVAKGNQLNRIFTQLPQYVQHQLTRGKFADRVPGFIRELARDEGERTSITTDRELDLERATQFSEKNSRSLNVVIPELLSMIHNELYISRTGDTKHQPVSYDYEAGKFVTQKDRRIGALKILSSDEDRQSNREHIDSIFAELDPSGKKLKADERQAISEELYRQNKANRYFDKSYFEDVDFMNGVKGGEKFRKLIAGHLTDDHLGERETALSKNLGRIGQHSGDLTDVVQAMYHSGRGAELAQMGLLDMTTGKLNTELIRRLELGQVSLDELAGGPTVNAPNLMLPDGTGGGGGVAPVIPTPQTPISGFLAGSGGLDLMKLLEQATPAPSTAPLTGRQKRMNPRQLKKDQQKNGVKSSISDPSHLDWKGMETMWKETSDLLNKISRDSMLASDSVTKITDAINAANGKTELEEIRDILRNIEQKDFSSVVVGEEAVEKLSQMFLGMKDRVAGNKYVNFAKTTAKKAWDWGVNRTKSSWNTTFNLANKAKEAAMGLLGTAKDFLTDQKEEWDLYVGRGKFPRLSAAKLKAGLYKDALTGKIIEKFEDITGDVMDIETDQIVLRADEIKRAVLRNFKTGKTHLARATSWGKKVAEKALKSIKESGQRALAMAGGVYGMGFQMATKLWDMVVDGPQDIYVKGQMDTPILFKYIMEAGGYFDRKSGDPVTKPSQIKGPIIDNDGNIVLSSKALKKGLVDRKGRPLRTGIGKLLEMGREKIFGLLDFGKNAWNKAKDMFSGMWEWVGGAKSPLTITTRKTNEILTDILELLLERLPAAKVAGDLDGDGLVNGSYEDIVKKRKEKKEKKEEDRKNPDGTKGKPGQLTGLAAVMDMMRKDKKKADEEEGDDGDTYIYAGGEGGDDKKKDGKGKGGKPGKPAAPAKPKGFFGRNWDKVKKFLTPKEGSLMAKGVSAGGKVLKAGWSVAKMLGTALTFGSIASATGVVAGGAGAVAAGAGILGAIGSVLSVGAGAIASILSSPIVLGGAAVAAVGYGGYKAFQWLTEKTPGEIGKVRLVQYGWSAGDTEKFGDMLKIEAIARKAVTFSGNEASFDTSKLDIKAMMDVFGMDPKNEDHAKKFLNWFANRFKIFYLNHLGLMKQMGYSFDPVEIDDKLNEKQKLEYLKQCLFPGDAYQIPTSPYKKEIFLAMAQGSAERQIETATQELQKKVDRSQMTDEQRREEIKTRIATDLGLDPAETLKKAAAEQKLDAKSVQGVPERLGPEAAAQAALGIGQQNSANARFKDAIGGGNFDKDPVTGAPAGPGGGPGGPASVDGYKGGAPINHPGNGTGGNINDIPVPTGNKSWSAMKDVLLKSAKMAGVSPRSAVSIAAIESGFDYTARPWNKNKQKFESSAKGLFQFLDGTWDGMMSKYAGKYGIDKSTTAMDPRANALMGMEFLKENTAYLRKKLGREPTATDVYMAHFMGPGGAVNFLSKNPNTLGASVFPKEAASNSWVYYHDGDKMQKPKTLGEIYQGFTVKLAKRLKDYGVMDSELDSAPGPLNAEDKNKAAADAAANPAAQQGQGGGNADTTPVSDPSNPPPNQQSAKGTSADPKANAPAYNDIPESKPAPRSAPPGYSPGNGAPPSAPNPNASLPVRMGNSPTPAASPQEAQAPVQTQTTQSRSADQYARENSNLNQGEVPGLLKDALAQQKSAADSLLRLVDLMETLPTRLGEVIAGGRGQPAPAPSRPAPQKVAQKAPVMNESYRRSLTGQST